MPQDYIVLRDGELPNLGSPFEFNMGGLDLGVNAGPTVSVESLERSQLSTLRQDRSIRAVAPNYAIRLSSPVSREALAASPAAQTTWGIAAVKADASPYTGAGVTVAVLDSGIDAAHPAFDGHDIVEKDFTGEGNGDLNGHGTHVAGTIFGKEVKGARFGIAPGIKRALIGKVLDRNGDGTTEGVLKGIQWAFDEGADIICMSLGISFPRIVQGLIAKGLPSDLATDIGLQGYRANVRLFDNILEMILGSDANPNPGFLGISRGCLAIIAAGNESKRDVDPDYELAVAPPASVKDAVSVGALGQVGDDVGSLHTAAFSNTGCNVSAPGVGIISSVPGNGFASFDGTSMAAPHVSGVAALWAEQMLNESGRISTGLLAGKLTGQASKDRLFTGFDPWDVGAGLVQAPLV